MEEAVMVVVLGTSNVGEEYSKSNHMHLPIEVV